MKIHAMKATAAIPATSVRTATMFILVGRALTNEMAPPREHVDRADATSDPNGAARRLGGEQRAKPTMDIRRQRRPALTRQIPVIGGQRASLRGPGESYSDVLRLVEAEVLGEL